MRRAFFAALGLASLAAAFVLGGIAERVASSSRQEATYPWDLHRRINSDRIDCSRLAAARAASAPGVVESLDGGAILLVARYDVSTRTVTAWAFDSEHRLATDSWPLDCPP